MRYFFHIRERDAFIPDDEGMELRDLEAALWEARATAVEWTAADTRRDRCTNSAIVEITDWDGMLLEAVPMRGTLH